VSVDHFRERRYAHESPGPGTSLAELGTPGAVEALSHNIRVSEESPPELRYGSMMVCDYNG